MKTEKLKIAELRELIQTGDATDPLVFLECVMSGQDPRTLSSLAELVEEIDSFSDGNVSREDWQELVGKVRSEYRYHPVSLSQSITASKTLSEYVHAKRKTIELNGGLDLSQSNANLPLTESEIELFKEVWNSEF